MPEIVVNLLIAYVLAGIAFAIAFVARGANVLDPAAARSRWPFHAIIFPASVALWPLLAHRWIAKKRRTS